MEKEERKIIAVDFDGTVVTHEFPHVGKDIGAQKVLRRLVAKGHRLILYTMRSDIHLYEAKKWFADNDIELWGVQYNLEQAKWTSSNKCYAHLYIDDAALGCPLVIPDEGRPYVAWPEVEAELELLGYLDKGGKDIPIGCVKCNNCGTIYKPTELIPVCPNCRSTKQPFD